MSASDRVQLPLTRAAAIVVTCAAIACATVACSADAPTRSSAAESLPIAFSYDRDISVASADGATVHPLGIDGVLPEWSPDGRTLLFLDYGVDKTTLWIANEDGTNRQRLNTGVGTVSAGTWSPDGRSIAFYRQQQNAYPQLIVMRLDGSQLRVVSDSAELSGYAPSWSTTGRIAFSRPTGSIWTVNPDGTQLTRTISISGDTFFTYPKWSHDGRMLTFIASLPSPTGYGNERILIANGDGTGRHFVTDGPHDERPVFSRGGESILFDRVTAGCHLFKVAVAGGAPIDLTPGRTHGECFGASSR